MAQSGRLLSLDVMRGITIAGMIMVNNPGSWGYVYAPLRHASWNGLTPTDLVFPFFMFIMGVSMFFSLRKRYESTETDRADLPGRICLEFIRTSLLQRIFQFRKPAYPGSYAAAGTGLRDRLTDRIIR